MKDDPRSAERRSPPAGRGLARSAGVVGGTSAFRLKQRFDAPADRVFKAWVDPDIARHWLFATASHPMARAEIDARVGGAFRLADAEAEYRGKYLEIVPPRRLVFTLLLKNRPAAVTRVTAEVVPLKSGCELRLTHENVPPDHAHRTEGRWAGMLYGLGTQLR